jgi:acetyltransferase-like isoleucine patch superfamily enzyme
MHSEISHKATIGKNVQIGNYCNIHDDVIIDDNVIIEDYCTIGYPTPLAEGEPLILGKDSLIRSYSLFYQGSKFGCNLKTGHRVTVREKTNAGHDFQIGTLCDIQGHCEIGNHVRLHSNVFIGQKSRIANFVWLFPFVVLTNDPHPPSDGFTKGPEIQDYATIAAASCILPGVIVGKHALVAAHSLVNRDVGDHAVVGGVPAKFLCNVKEIPLRSGKGPAYPWPSHFHRGYPMHVVTEWEKGNFDFLD